MNIKQLTFNPYSDLVASTFDYIPECLGMVTGIAFDASGMHLTIVDLTPDARHEVIDWSNVHSKGLTQISEGGGDWLLRCTDEIVIDTDSSGLSASQLLLQQRIIAAILELKTNLRVRHGRASEVNRQLDGKQRSIAAAKFGFERKLRSLRFLFRKSCQQLDSSEEGDTTSSE